MTNCNCRSDCTLLGIIVSITIGIIAAILRYTAIVTVTPAFLWVIFGIAVVYLGITPLLGALGRLTGSGICICAPLTGIIAGTLGTILAGVLLLGISFAATSPVGAIIFGFLAGFFTLVLTSVACLTRCIARCDIGE